MAKNKLVRINVPRYTLIKGKLSGKYRSELDEHRSYSDLDRYYILYVYQSEISNGEPICEDDFELRDKLNQNIQLHQPVKLSAMINNEVKRFMVSFRSYEIEDPVLFDVITEGKHSFGSISAGIKGIVEDHKEIEVPEDDLEPTGKIEEKIVEGDVFQQKEYEYIYNGEKVFHYGDWEKVNISTPTLPPQTNKDNDRSPNGTNARHTNKSNTSARITRLFFTLLGFLLVYAGFPFLWPFLLLFGVFWILRFCSLRFPVFGGLLRRGVSLGGRLTYGLLSIVGILFWIFVIYSLLNISSCRTTEQADQEEKKSKKEQVKREEKSGRRRGEQHVTKGGHQIRKANREKSGPSEWISHPFTWYDYSNNEYSGVLAVRKRDKLHSTQLRNALAPHDVFKENYWNSVYYQLAVNDDSGMDSICSMLQSIRSEYELDSRNFADVIVSCIQHMPYELIMEGSCNPSEYDKTFIREYLGDGGKCACCSRFGLYSPIEYVANFAGDCDSRTLVLFTILSRFGYDVMILNSDVHGHSVLGINLPARGIAKEYQGNRYLIWETTAKGMEPGQFPSNLSDMSTWYIALTNNNKK